ncbi:N-acetylmuramoyl-L-alanine amidase CwlD [Peptococcaceae bacterium 1198_IL3148]
MAVYMRVMHFRKRYLLFAIILALIVAKIYDQTQIKLEQEAIEAMSWSVANKVIVIDPGHGGVDPGKVSPNGVEEKNINLEISKRLATILGQAGAAVILTRETDTHLSGDGIKGMSSRHREDLSQRVKMANDRNADLFISIHCNSYPDASQHGAQVFYQPGSKESQRLANCIQEEITRLLANTRRTPKAVDFFITRNTNMPTVIVETGFITNAKEEKLLLDPAYQSKMAWSIYAGVIKYYAENVENTEQAN